MASRIRDRRWLASLGVLAVFAASYLVTAKAKQGKPAERAGEPVFLVQEPTPKSAEPVALPADPGLPTAPPAMPDPAGPPPVASKPPITEDPEGSATEFLDRSRREATEAVHALSTEAEALRARLARTEAGLKRWQGVLAALDAQGPAAPAAEKVETRPAEALEPAQPTRRVDPGDMSPVKESAPANSEIPVPPPAPTEVPKDAP